MEKLKTMKVLLMVVFCMVTIITIIPSGTTRLIVASPDKNSKKAKNEPPADPTQYVGSESCAECHANEATHYSVTAHKKTMAGNFPFDQRGCEACHGGAKKHVEFHKASQQLYEDGKPEEAEAL